MSTPDKSNELITLLSSMITSEPLVHEITIDDKDIDLNNLITSAQNDIISDDEDDEDFPSDCDCSDESDEEESYSSDSETDENFPSDNECSDDEFSDDELQYDCE